jgi:hypothetical protein
MPRAGFSGGHDRGQGLACVARHDGAMRAKTVKVLATVLLATLSSHALAQWVRVSSSQQSVFYIDARKSQRVGNNVMIWVLRDHKAMQPANGLAVRSSKDQIEVDCAGRRIRRIFSSDHGRPMGNGPMLHSEHGPMSWNAAPPNSTVSRIVDVACAST